MCISFCYKNKPDGYAQMRDCGTFSMIKYDIYLFSLLNIDFQIEIIRKKDLHLKGERLWDVYFTLLQ